MSKIAAGRTSDCMRILQVVISACSSLVLAAVLPAVPANADDGTVGPESVSQCQSSQFCLWSSSNYAGTFTYTTGSGVTRTLGYTVNSVWNNRTKAARLYNNSGTSYTCLAAGTKKSVLSSSYQRPAKVTLSSTASC